RQRAVLCADRRRSPGHRRDLRGARACWLAPHGGRAERALLPRGRRLPRAHRGGGEHAGVLGHLRVHAFARPLRAAPSAYARVVHPGTRERGGLRGVPAPLSGGAARAPRGGQLRGRRHVRQPRLPRHRPHRSCRRGGRRGRNGRPQALHLRSQALRWTMASAVTPQRFASGMTFDEYVAYARTPENLAREAGWWLGTEGQDPSGRLRTWYEQRRLSDAQGEAIRWLVRQPDGPARILVISEEWSSDCRRDVPILARLAEAGGLELRIFPRDGRTLGRGSRADPAESPNADIVNEFLRERGGQTYQSVP